MLIIPPKGFTNHSFKLFNKQNNTYGVMPGAGEAGDVKKDVSEAFNLIWI